MWVVIDGVALGRVAYSQCRGTVGNPVPDGIYCDDDVASIFGNATPRATFTAFATAFSGGSSYPPSRARWSSRTSSAS